MPTCRLLLSFVAVSLFTTSTAFADLVNVSITGSVSVNGTFNNAPFPCETGITPQDFSFSGTNSLEGFGAYSLSRAGEEDCGIPFSQPYDSASASQTANVTSQSLTLATELSTGANGMNLFPFIVFPAAGASSTLTITFDLSEPSLMVLTGSLTNDCEGFLVSGCPTPPPQDGNAGGSVELSGPGVDIIQINGSFTLDPGHYVLTASSFASSSTDIIVGSSSDLSLDAEFMAITPEPRWLIAFPFLLLLFLHRVRSRLAV